MSVENELSRAWTPDDMRPLALAVRPELAARLLRQDEPLVLPAREVLRRVHRETIEVVVGGRAREVLAVQIEGVAHLDDPSAVSVDGVAVGVTERDAWRIGRRD